MHPMFDFWVEKMREEGYAVVAIPPQILAFPADNPMPREDLEGFLTRMAERRLRLRAQHLFSQRIGDNTEFLDRPGCCGPYVAVVWSGRDCDGVQYSGEVHLVPANPKDVEKHIDSTYSYADGPCSYAIVKPSEAEKIEYHSRDLTLEAFENGRNFNITPED